MATQSSLHRPSSEDVARRLLILKYVAAYALTAPPLDVLRKSFKNWSEEDQRKFVSDGEVRRDEFWGKLRHLGLWEYLSPTERGLAATTILTMSPQQRVNATWRVEAVQVLMWAVGMIPELPPYDTKASHELLKQIPSQDVPKFLASTRLRKTAEIDDARSDAELWHWRSCTRQLIEEGARLPSEIQSRGFRSYDDIVRLMAQGLAKEGRIKTIDEDFPLKGRAYREVNDQEWSEVRSLTMERHFALNWLCGHAPGNDWDKTPTDT